MPIYRVSYDVDIPLLNAATIELRVNDQPYLSSRMKVSRVMGPRGKRKRWQVVQNGKIPCLFCGVSLKDAKFHLKEFQRLHSRAKFSIVEV